VSDSDPGDTSDAVEHEAITGLERLGLSNYEARVFTALQKLGDGTAKEIHDVAGVPRSQVYGAAEELERRGLLEIQNATPKRYRPVSLDVAEERLSDAIRHEQELAFDYLSTVRDAKCAGESREDVWTVRGGAPVSSRTAKLAAEAADRILYGADSTEQVTDEIVDVLRERAVAGVEVVVVSATAAVRERFEGLPVTVLAPPQSGAADFDGRVLLVDDETVLLSVRSDSGTHAGETAIWSAETAMARVIVRITENGIRTILDG
jgi:sugar-specific transcriptional regulator TrmB